MFPTAANIFNSGDQHILRQPLSAADVRKVQSAPLGLVIILLPAPSAATAQNNLASGAQQTERQIFCAGACWAVQLIPSGLVITDVPVAETAQKILSSGDQQTLPQDPDGPALLVQLMPSGLVMTGVPKFATAQNNVSSGDQQIDCQAGSAETGPVVLCVQFIPSVLVIAAELPALLAATAQKILNCGDQQTDAQLPVGGLVFPDQPIPSELLKELPLPKVADLPTATNKPNSGDQVTASLSSAVDDLDEFHSIPL